jgi:type IV secretory pathway VirB9-like protein
MFLNVFSTVVINDNYLTTIVFDEPVGRIHSGASGQQLYIKKSPDSKMIFIKSKGKNLLTNLNVPTKGGKLYTFLLRSGSKPHSIIQIKDGKKTSLFKNVVKSRSYLIEDSENTTKITNKSSSKMTINTIELVPGSSYEFPNGSPLFLDDRRIYR